MVIAFTIYRACIYCAGLLTISTVLRVYFEELWYLSCNGVEGTPTITHDCGNYFIYCDYPQPPPPQKKKKKSHTEQVASHLKPPSPLLTLELNPLAHLFIFTRSYFHSVPLLHSIVAKLAV